MRNVRDWIKAFVQDEDGPTAVEYAVMLAFIIVAVAAAVTALGGAASNSFANPTLNNAL